MLCFNLYIPFLFVFIDRVPSTICWCVFFFSIVDAINFFSHFFQTFNVWRERKTGSEREEEKNQMFNLYQVVKKKWKSKEIGNYSETTSKCNHNIRRRLAIIQHEACSDTPQNSLYLYLHHHHHRRRRRHRCGCWCCSSSTLCFIFNISIQYIKLVMCSIAFVSLCLIVKMRLFTSELNS